MNVIERGNPSQQLKSADHEMSCSVQTITNENVRERSPKVLNLDFHKKNSFFMTGICHNCADGV